MIEQGRKKIEKAKGVGTIRRKSGAIVGAGADVGAGTEEFDIDSKLIELEDLKIELEALVDSGEEGEAAEGGEGKVMTMVQRVTRCYGEVAEWCVVYTLSFYAVYCLRRDVNLGALKTHLL